MTHTDWWRDVEKVIEANSLLKHPFYQAWQQGKLSPDDLRYYAVEYYPHVAAFPRYVSAVHSNTPELKARQTLLENLIAEEQGAENHPELWLRFAEGLGLKREDVLGAEPQPETSKCVEAFLSLTRDTDHLVGLSALYAYESQIPAVSATKRDGLRRFYGINDEASHAFFAVHEAADVWHARAERELIEASARTPERRERVSQAASAACRAVNTLLDGVVRARAVHAAC